MKYRGFRPTTDCVKWPNIPTIIDFPFHSNTNYQQIWTKLKFVPRGGLLSGLISSRDFPVVKGGGLRRVEYGTER